ncbi:MAG TPA: hypothetical protein ENH62_10755 [Marinobacter sp.]|uniref:DUF6843 domain-containing protein n=2 Tax=root TaxID=1 RepID=A0A831R7F9_9GAMM|nr:hypothetical protein [Marinobacter antarcticus]HDZ38751.1 hypothetical protein [Marinobacter sp.]HEA53755.1 hypothetical protein [Marinobacter antarcticus]
MIIKQAGQRHRLKTKLIFLTCLFAFMVTACAGSKNVREPEMYLLPENYTGSVYVVFDVNKGQAPEYNRDYRVYRLPESGVLLTQMPMNEGVIEEEKVKFFAITEEGEKVELKNQLYSTIHETAQNRADKKTYLFGVGLGSLDLKDPHCTVFYRGFQIGTESDILDRDNFFRLRPYLQNQGIDCNDIGE